MPKGSDLKVDLVINCYERTYRDVLSPGFFQKVAESCQFSFTQHTVLLNNIRDMEGALRLCEERIADGGIHQFFRVEDYIDDALRVAGLTHRDLNNIPYYSNWALVALIVPGNEFMVHWDAEIRMVEPYNWVEPSLRLMQADPRVAVANPLWDTKGNVREFREKNGEFMLGYGFSDQIYLISRKEFAKPVYHSWVPISLRYPVAHIAPYFEQMVDSYMRVNRRYRATLTAARYQHPVAEGAAYPSGIKARILFAAKRAAVGLMRHFPGKHRYFHD
jgi:hypothetical protein